MDQQTKPETFVLAVTYFLSDAGQKEALRRGFDARRKQTLTGPAPVQWLDELPVKVDPDGAASLDLTKIADGYTCDFDEPATAPEDAVRLWKYLDTQKRAKLAEELDTKKREWMAGDSTHVWPEALGRDPEVAAELLRRRVAAWLAGPVRRFSGDGLTPPPDGAKGWPEVAAEWTRRLTADAAEREERARTIAEETAATERRAAERRDWTLAFLRENGTTDQAERFEAGMLPAAELRETLERVFLARLDAFERFGRVAAFDVCEECWERIEADAVPEEDLFTFRSKPATELHGAQWTLLQAIRKALPEGATAEPRLRTAECDNPYHTTVGHGCGPEAHDVLVKLSTPAGVDLRVSLALPE